MEEGQEGLAALVATRVVPDLDPSVVAVASSPGQLRYWECLEVDQKYSEALEGAAQARPLLPDANHEPSRHSSLHGI